MSQIIALTLTRYAQRGRRVHEDEVTFATPARNRPGSISLGSDRLSAAFVDVHNQIVISAVVPWELAIKTRIGKLKAWPLLEQWYEIVESQGYTELPVDWTLPIRAGSLPCIIATRLIECW